MSDERPPLAPREASIPRLLVVLVLLTLGTSGFVMIEPAPCDVLFLPMAVAALLTARSLTPVRVDGWTAIGSIVFLVANVVALQVADHPLHALRFFAITAYLFAFAFTIAALIDRYGAGMLRWMFVGFTIAALATAGIGLLARLHLVPDPEIFFRDEHGTRIKSTFKDPNVFGPFMVAAVIWTMAVTLERRRIELRALAAFTLYGVALLLSFSRGAYLNLAVSMAVFLGLHFLVLRDPRALTRLSVTGVLAAAIVVPAMVLALAQFSLSDYFMERLSLQSYDSERFVTHHEALTVAAQSPLGIGPGEWREGAYRQAMHNLYLRVVVETGWIGALGFLVFIASVILQALRSVFARGSHAGLQAAFAAVILGSLAESVVIDTLHWRHLFLFIGLAVGVRVHERRLRESARPRPVAGRSEPRRFSNAPRSGAAPT